MECQRAAERRRFGALAPAVAVAMAIGGVLPFAACVSGPPLGQPQALPPLVGDGRVAAVAAAGEVVGALPGLSASLAAVGSSTVASAADIDVAAELASVASVELALGARQWLAVIRPNDRFPARFIGWTVSATEGFRYRRVREADPAFSFWRGNGVDVAVFEDALLFASSPPASAAQTSGTRHGAARPAGNLSPLQAVSAALREPAPLPAAAPLVALYLPDLAAGLPALAAPEAAGTLVPLLGVVPLTTVHLQVAVAGGADGALEVTATLGVARPPARRYVPLARLALVSVLAELQLPATRTRGVEVGASDDDTAIELRRLMLSEEELIRILSDMVQGAETTMAAAANG